jgi:alkylhydroperoxidase family enzyme
LTEDEIAALDSEWSQYDEAKQAAFVLARKLSYEPHLIDDGDIQSLRKHYTDLQILEMIVSVAGNNSTNRWKEGAGIPQSHSSANFLRSGAKAVPTDRLLPIETYLTPTSDRFVSRITSTAPLASDDAGKPTRQTVQKRPPLEPRGEVERALAACRQRTPRLPLVGNAKAKEILAEAWPHDRLPAWVRLLANFSREGKSRIAAHRRAEEEGDLSPLLKAQVSWIIARQDRAWYAVGEAQHRLRKLGCSDDRIYSLDGDWHEFTPAERAQFTLARDLAASPIVLSDEDVAQALQHTSPREVVQLVTYTTTRSFFDRVTEAAGLQLEP